MKTYIVAFCTVLELVTCGYAGELRGRITDLIGNSRPTLPFSYKIVLRHPDTGVTSLYMKSTGVTSSVDPINKDPGGQFNITLPNAGLPNSREVTIEITPDDIKLANVNLDSLLGSSNHDITVVMPVVKAKAAAAPDDLVTTYHGPRGNFHLIEHGGTAFYCISGRSKPILTQLEYVRRDERYFYFSEREGEFGGNREWAFSRSAREMYRVCGRCCSGRFSGYPVWLMAGDPASPKWQFFEWARQIVPANGNVPIGLDVPPDQDDVDFGQMQSK